MYDQANNLIKDLKGIKDPLYPVCIADIQNQNFSYQYIGNRYYLGQEYLYVNLAKSSTGYFGNIREEQSISTLFSKVISSIQGMITAFDLYTAPAEGFCYGRFSTENLQGFPVNQPVTQLGKYYGKTPFVIYLTGLYQSTPFSQLIQVANEQINQADSALSKMWHGRYIQELESGQQSNTVVQEVLYESLANRVLSKYTAFLCLEPSDTVAVCNTCKDESRLVGIEDLIIADSASLVNLYPNPFSEKLNIDIDLGRMEGLEQAIVRIFNFNGQLVWERNEPGFAGQMLHMEWNGNSIRGAEVPAGQYLVMIQAGPATWSKQVIKSE
jgi:Ca-activated chloride channel family protein